MTINDIHARIKSRFLYYSEHKITENSVMDLYSLAVSDVMNELYKEIENSKMPHLYTKLTDQSLDDLGYLLSTPREVEESDVQYLYRLMNWKYSAESSNEKAINTALLNRTYASYVEYIPKTHGSGTGTVYIIPKTYDNPEVIENAISECIDVMERVSSPSLYVEYTIPGPKPVILNIALEIADNGDPGSIKRSLEKQIKEYVNNIPPDKYMLLGLINKIGVNEDYVDYFNLLQVFIDGKEQDEIEILQNLEDKYLLEEIVWNE
ncbi:hypothetical protein [Lysinibacillus fusiformis]|uniref:hypothetical protein n=1 Tax=Lysinibacillus fusiformis TaxID=28031 RepID=UPI00215B22AD|nr:hypothetical protein [Lysinibacillus fusiformis]MCR8854892.1 hypothetical protein [Lysinibacillus fusiformis]WKT77125.1 hypothetical protein QYY55_24610 [Lysinibacillus fusiformis]